MSDPRKELLDRQVMESLRPVVGAAAGVLDECVNYGTHLVVKCDQGATQRGHMEAVVLLGLHVVEVVDAVAILTRHSCVSPTKNLLRSQMEAMFGIEYIAQGDSERKAIQYIVAHAHFRIDWYKKLDPTVETGKHLKARIRKDSSLHDLDIVGLDTTAYIANLENMLARPEYAATEAEWQRMRQVRGGQIWWYSLFDGPKRVEELATAVGDHAWYELLYRFYSGEVHATNAIESLHGTHGVEGAYQPLRYPTDLPAVARIAVSMALRTYRKLIDMLCPGERQHYAAWYRNEVEPILKRFEQCEIIDAGRPSRTPPRRPTS